LDLEMSGRRRRIDGSRVRNKGWWPIGNEGCWGGGVVQQKKKVDK